MKKPVSQLIISGTTCKLELDSLNTADWHQDLGYHKRLPFFTRLFDISVSLIVLLLTAPIMLLSALAIVVESGFRGPVFYRQTRVGYRGETFSLIKFRSMTTDAEKNGAQWAATNDSRITRIGGFLRKTRIDELPQFLNVLQGDMSVVGPRPERPEFTSELENHIPHYDMRHQVKPGITGWAQVHYPYGASVEDTKNKLEYDLFYLKHSHLLLDILVAFKTVRVCLVGAGAR